jgi:chemotaxis protein MotA
MIGFAGIGLILVAVFGTFVITGGKIAILIEAIPFELMTIMGAGIGAFVISNSLHLVKATMKEFKLVFSGSRWTKADFRDLLCLLYEIIRLIKQKGVLALEQHIENPETSEIFSKYPRILHDHFAMGFLADTLRMVSMNLDDPHQIEDSMEKQLKKHHHETMAPATALQMMADGLPAIGIVAAVLGVIKTMASIDQPPAILGRMIGSALVGTFLGVFLAYCIVGPFSSRIKEAHTQDMQFYAIIRDTYIAYLKGNPAAICVEIARGNVPTCFQPSFGELEEALQGATDTGAKPAAKAA